MNTITRHRGFTLIELLVVISIIVLVSLGVIPTVRKLLQAQTGAQAASLFSAQLSAARAEAIVSGNYTALHSQLSDRTDETEDQCFLAVLSYQELVTSVEYRQGRYALAMAPGHVPLPVPGNQAYGRLDAGFVSATSFSNIDNLQKFTTLTVVFDRQGQVTPMMYFPWLFIPGGPPGFANPRFFNTISGKGLFTNSTTASGTALWRVRSNGSPDSCPEYRYDLPGVSGACVFDYKKLSLIPASARGAYLDANARILPINTYTGSLFDMD
jgi:prepilin-type N-terminal cleavage/methylation domain-containing protein